MITSFNIYESLEIGEGLFLQKGVMVLLKNSWFLIIYPLKSFLQKIDQFIFCVSLSEIAASWDRDGRDGKPLGLPCSLGTQCWALWGHGQGSPSAHLCPAPRFTCHLFSGERNWEMNEGWQAEIYEPVNVLGRSI